MIPAYFMIILQFHLDKTYIIAHIQPLTNAVIESDFFDFLTADPTLCFCGESVFSLPEWKWVFSLLPAKMPPTVQCGTVHGDYCPLLFNRCFSSIKANGTLMAVPDNSLWNFSHNTCLICSVYWLPGDTTVKFMQSYFCLWKNHLVIS